MFPFYDDRKVFYLGLLTEIYNTFHLFCLWVKYIYNLSVYRNDYTIILCPKHTPTTPHDYSPKTTLHMFWLKYILYQYPKKYTVLSLDFCVWYTNYIHWTMDSLETNSALVLFNTIIIFTFSIVQICWIFNGK